MTPSCKRRYDSNFLLPAPKSTQNFDSSESAQGPSKSNFFALIFATALIASIFFCQVSLGPFGRETYIIKVQGPGPSPSSFAEILGDPNQAGTTEQPGGREREDSEGTIGEISEQDVAQKVSDKGKQETPESVSAGRKTSKWRTCSSRFSKVCLSKQEGQVTQQWGGLRLGVIISAFTLIMAVPFVCFMIYLKDTTSDPAEFFEDSKSKPCGAILISLYFLGFLSYLCFFSTLGLRVFKDDEKFCIFPCPNCPGKFESNSVCTIKSWDCALASVSLSIVGCLASWVVFLWFVLPDVTVHNEVTGMYGIQPNDGALYDIAIEEMGTTLDERSADKCPVESLQSICKPIFYFPGDRKEFVTIDIQEDFEWNMAERGYPDIEPLPRA